MHLGARIRRAMQEDFVIIEHFGSMAMFGMAVKPIIDMLEEVTPLEYAKGSPGGKNDERNIPFHLFS